MFWVGQVRVRGQPVDIHHAHFVPTGAEDSTLALNQNDNGFGEYPALTVGQLRRIGSVQKPEILVQYRQVSNKK